MEADTGDLEPELPLLLPGDFCWPVDGEVLLGVEEQAGRCSSTADDIANAVINESLALKL